ncbi:hypothetical protein KAJ27_18045 [bacterium]|nr:hypothetical protein [bacterium]
MIPKKEVKIGKPVVIETPRNGVYLGWVIDADEQGFFSKATNNEIIYIPYGDIA